MTIKLKYLISIEFDSWAKELIIGLLTKQTNMAEMSHLELKILKSISILLKRYFRASSLAIYWLLNSKFHNTLKECQDVSPKTSTTDWKICVLVSARVRCASLGAIRI